MAKFFARWRMRRHNIDSERGNAILMTSILAIPLILGMFGYGIDFTLGQAARIAIQQDLDNATQSALGQLSNPVSTNTTQSAPRPIYDSANDTNPECRSTTASRWMQCKTFVLYKLSRTNIPLRSCYNDARVGSNWQPVATPDGCRFYMVGTPTYTSTGSTYKRTFSFSITVREQIHYTFLQFLGHPTQDIQVTSTATTSSAYLDR